MKIYTKKGDEGTTQLIGGNRVSKAEMRIDAYGTVDELNSFVGFLRDQQIAPVYVSQLIEVQDRLFTLGSLLASEPGVKMELPLLKSEDISLLEEWIDKMDQELEPMRSFVLPGGHQAVSAAHICRTVCRRAERQVVALSNLGEIPKLSLKYLNRLSDYLFVLGRKVTSDLKVEETPWKPRMD
jgi:cob(I)alamin adenosyltransferase